MSAKRRREPIFVDGTYALIALAVIAWPLWILVKYLMDKLGWFSVHLFASQIIGFLILVWVVLVIISAVIALIRKREEQCHHYYLHRCGPSAEPNLPSKPQVIRRTGGDSAGRLANLNTIGHASSSPKQLFCRYRS
jgi:hypothetical protein